jgi:hypothetical protein
MTKITIKEYFSNANSPKFNSALRFRLVLCSLEKKHLQFFHFRSIFCRLNFESVSNSLMLQLHARNIVCFSTVGFLKSADLFFELLFLIGKFFLVTASFLYQIDLKSKLKTNRK